MNSVYENSNHFIREFVPLSFNGTKMERKIKLIWDFRGPASAKTAEHHEIHLKEFDGEYDIDELRLMRIKFISEVAN